MSDTALILFIKNPELGKAKTRLAKTVGAEKALQIYKALLQHTRAECTKVDCTRYLYYSRFVDETDEWSDQHFHKRLQEGLDLGERMEKAFQKTLQQHQRAIIIGSDCASLTADHLRQAIQALQDHDLVIGPARDGGYYLLGMNLPLRPSLFSQIKWSTDEVLTATIARIKKLGASYTLLPELSDIDTEADWEKFGWEL